MTVGQAIEIVAHVDETGTKEPIIQRQGNNRILLQLPGVDDPEQVKSCLVKRQNLVFSLLIYQHRQKQKKYSSACLRV